MQCRLWSTPSVVPARSPAGDVDVGARRAAAVLDHRKNEGTIAKNELSLVALEPVRTSTYNLGLLGGR